MFNPFKRLTCLSFPPMSFAVVWTMLGALLAEVLLLVVMVLVLAVRPVQAAQSPDGLYHWRYSSIGEFTTHSDGCMEVATALQRTIFEKSSGGTGAPWTSVIVDFNTCTTRGAVAHVGGVVPMIFDGGHFDQPVALASEP